MCVQLTREIVQKMKQSVKTQSLLGECVSQDVQVRFIIFFYYSPCCIISVGCHTYSGLKCVLPFIFNGTEYTECVQDADPNLTWCATQVEEDGVMVEGSWEYCHNGC